MRRYLLFAGHCYYPSGGWRDFQGSFDSPTDAGLHFGKLDFNSYIDHWGQVVDADNWKIIQTLRQEYAHRSDICVGGPVVVTQGGDED